MYDDGSSQHNGHLSLVSSAGQIWQLCSWSWVSLNQTICSCVFNPEPGMKAHAIYNDLQVHGAPDIRVLFPPIWGQEHDIQGRWFDNHSENKANKFFGGDWTLPPQKENRSLVRQSQVNVKQFQLNSWKLVEQCKFCRKKKVGGKIGPTWWSLKRGPTYWWKNGTNLVFFQANPRRVKVESRGDTIVSLLYAGKIKKTSKSERKWK